MNTNKILLGGIIGGIVFFLLGWLIYGMMLYDFMSANGNQCAARPETEMIWWALILGNIAGGLMLAVIFSWSNVTTMSGGMVKGAIIGLFYSIMFDFMMYSMSTFFTSITPVIVDICVSTVMTAVAGAVIAWIMNTGKKS